MSDCLDKLFTAIATARERDPSTSKTSKLFRDGVQKMAKKLAEEAIEVGLDAVLMRRDAVIRESADLLYHLAVIWVECGVTPREVVEEIDRRERTYGCPEKLPKHDAGSNVHALLPRARQKGKREPQH
jgi:phosphoribosyl-ATP pyrophosphohydrolase